MNITPQQLSVFYHPSRIFIVDDNRDFLVNFSLQLDPDLAYCLFSSPHEAIRQLLQIEPNNQLDKRVLSLQQEETENATIEHSLNIDLSLIQQEIFNQNRFDAISVIVVDYDMPSMNGLDFCRRIQHLPVKKIMLTGKADEALAIEAFNQGLIQNFVHKNSPNIIQEINQTLKKLQHDYFSKMSENILHLWALYNNRLLSDPAFVAFFTDLCQKK